MKRKFPLPKITANTIHMFYIGSQVVINISKTQRISLLFDGYTLKGFEVFKTSLELIPGCWQIHAIEDFPCQIDTEGNITKGKEKVLSFSAVRIG